MTNPVAKSIYMHGLCAVKSYKISNVLLAQAHPTMVKQLPTIMMSQTTVTIYSWIR